MRTRNKLKARQVATFTQPNVYSDDGGLYLRVRPSGTKSWIFVRIVNKRRRGLGLGSALDVTLAEAREKASELRRMFRDGKDPVAERRAQEKEARAAQTVKERRWGDLRAEASKRAAPLECDEEETDEDGWA